MARQVKKEDIETNPVFAEFLQHCRAKSEQQQQQQQKISRRTSRTSRKSSSHCCSSEAGSSSRSSCCRCRSAGQYHYHRACHFNRRSPSVRSRKSANNDLKAAKNGRANNIDGVASGDDVECAGLEVEPGPGGPGGPGGGEPADARDTGCRAFIRRPLEWRQNVQFKWLSFKEERQDYSLWYFSPEDK